MIFSRLTSICSAALVLMASIYCACANASSMAPKLEAQASAQHECCDSSEKESDQAPNPQSHHHESGCPHCDAAGVVQVSATNNFQPITAPVDFLTGLPSWTSLLSQTFRLDSPVISDLPPPTASTLLSLHCALVI